MAISQQERLNDRQEAIRTALNAFSAGLWVCLPAIVQSYDATEGVVSVLPAIEAQITQKDGTQVWQPMPVISDCPVIFPGGGGFVATFPIQPGDECLVVFADRCISGWWQSGEVRKQAKPRMHSLSDGFAFIGPFSKPNVPPNISASSAQLRSVDGQAYVELAAGHIVNIVAPGGVNITAPQVTVNGSLIVTGTTTGQGNMSIQGTVSATGDGHFGNHSVATHVHSGVLSGGANTGPAVG